MQRIFRSLKLTRIIATLARLRLPSRFRWYRYTKFSDLSPTNSLRKGNNLQFVSEDGNESLPVLPVPNLR